MIQDTQPHLKRLDFHWGILNQVLQTAFKKDKSPMSHLNLRLGLILINPIPLVDVICL